VFLQQCVDIGNATTTLVPDSFKVDEKSDYMQWTVSITMPLNWSDAACIQAYGPMGRNASSIGRTNVTANLMYSLTRPDKMTAPAGDPKAYVPVTIAEKDPIRHKYGFFDFIAWSRDQDSGQVAAQQYL